MENIDLSQLQNQTSSEQSNQSLALLHLRMLSSFSGSFSYFSFQLVLSKVFLSSDSTDGFCDDVDDTEEVSVIWGERRFVKL